MLRLVPGWTLHEDPEALNTLAERAHAQLVIGRPMASEDDGQLPLQAWARLGTRLSGDEPCARLTPFHGLVGSDRITLVPPAELQLDEIESRALFASVQPLFESEGVRLEWADPLNWTVLHDSLKGLPCASLPRASGDSVQRWQGCTPLAGSRLLRRLQNEAQMVLHDHPVNQQRAQRGDLAVNSLWLDHAGAAEDVANSPTGPALVQALARVQTLTLLDADTALQAWVDAALAAPPGHAGTPQEPTLVLCGRHQAQAFTMRHLPSGWRGAIARTLMRPPPTQPLSHWLKTLDTAPEDVSA